MPIRKISRLGRVLKARVGRKLGPRGRKHIKKRISQAKSLASKAGRGFMSNKVGAAIDLTGAAALGYAATRPRRKKRRRS